MSTNLKKSIPVTLYRASRNPFLFLQNEFNKVMDDFYGWFEPFNFPAEPFENLTINPAIDVVEDREKFKVECEMPGMGEEDIKVHIENGVLNIQGEKTISKQDKDKKYRSREIGYGSYKRSISLPDSVDPGQAKASFKKGMLWIEIPKKHVSVEERHDIRVGEA